MIPWKLLQRLMFILETRDTACRRIKSISIILKEKRMGNGPRIECCEATEYSVWISFNRIECNKSAGKSVWLNHIRNGVVCKNLIGLFGAVLSWPHNAKKILQWPMKTNGSLKWYAGNFGYPNSRGERERDTLSQSIATVQKVNLTNFIRKHERREPPFKGRGRSNLWEKCCQACT